jgi:CHAT domain-containing protein
MKLRCYLIVLCCTVISFDAKADDYSIAERAFKQGDFSKSECYFKLAIEEFKLHNQQRELANTINRLGENLRILGREKEAEQLLHQNERSVINQPNLLLQLAQCYDVLGELRYYIFDNVKAGYYFRKSLQIKKNLLKACDADLALSYSNMGRYYNFTQQLDSAIILNKKAYQIITNHPVNNNYINFERIYCEYAYAVKEQNGKENEGWYSAKVRPILFEALQYNHRCYHYQKNYWLATVMHSLGNTYTDELNFNLIRKLPIDNEKKIFCHDQALKFYKAAAMIFKGIKPENNPRLSMTYFVMGLADSYFGADPRSSLKNYQKALQQIIPETDTDNYYTLPVTKNSPYNIHQYLTLISFKIDALDRLTKKQPSITEQRDIIYHTDKLVAVWAELIKQYQLDNNKDITTYYFKPPYDVALTACVNLYNRTHQRRYLERAFYYIELSKYGAFFKENLVKSSKVSDFLNYLQFTTLNITRIQNNLNPLEAIYDIYDGDDAIITLVISKNDCQIRSVPITKSDLQSFDSLSKYINRTQFSDFKKAAYKAYLLFGLGSKILDSIKIVHILPGTSYSFSIPFTGLITTLKGNNYKTLDYLVYKFQFYYSLSMLLAPKPEAIKSNELKVLSASPSDMSPLIFNKLMVGHLIKYYHAKTIDANEPASLILNEFNNQNIIHIATHTVVNEQYPERSYIALNNQKIRLTDIYNKKTEANLINLASCETTLGKSNQPNGSVLSFVRAFSYAGAQAITSTLWKVDDEMTAKLYTNFYDELAKDEKKPLALQNAKINYLKKANNDGANPYYWAGIVLYGNTSAITISHQ